MDVPEHVVDPFGEQTTIPTFTLFLSKAVKEEKRIQCLSSMKSRQLLKMFVSILQHIMAHELSHLATPVSRNWTWSLFICFKVCFVVVFVVAVFVVVINFVVVAVVIVIAENEG